MFVIASTSQLSITWSLVPQSLVIYCLKIRLATILFFHSLPATPPQIKAQPPIFSLMAHLVNKIKPTTPEISLRNRRLQECRASCFSLCKRGDETGLMPMALAHGSLSLPSLAFSYCGIHDRYHCVRHKNGGLLQPSCGECAVIYYAGHHDAIPMVEEDQRSL